MKRKRREKWGRGAYNSSHKFVFVWVIHMGGSVNGSHHQKQY